MIKVKLKHHISCVWNYIVILCVCVCVHMYLCLYVHKQQPIGFQVWGDNESNDWKIIKFPDRIPISLTNFNRL